jgi:hypothetical protein
MKTPRSRVLATLSTALLTGLLGAIPARADEAKPKPAAPAPTPPPAAAQTVVSTPPKPGVSKQAEENAQSRLQPTTPDKLIEKYGAVGAAVVRPDKVNPLQLINPFAPASYGNVGTPPAVWGWNAKLLPGQAPLPRSFQDDRTHEASGVVLSIGTR